MFKKVISATALLAFAFTSSAQAEYKHHWAAPSTLRLQVSAHVLPSCTFSSHQSNGALDLNFGDVDANTVGAEQNTKLTYSCSEGARPKLALSDDDGSLRDTTRFALRSGHDAVDYNIHLGYRSGMEFKNSDKWAGALPVGSTHDVNLYAEIPNGNLLHAVPGHYSDIVTATLFF